MSKPIVHARSSARRYGGKPEDYFCVHDLMDSSKAALPDNRHRALTHQSWFIKEILEKIHMPEHKWFGPILINSAGREISVRDLGEQHILEDFGMKFIPTAQDYLQDVPIRHWHNNGAGGDVPPSHRKIDEQRRTGTRTTMDWKKD
jgi:hypothetical protein